MSQTIMQINQYINALDEDRLLYWSLGLTLLLSGFGTYSFDTLGMILLPIQIIGSLWFIYLATVDHSRKKKELKDALRRTIEARDASNT